MNRSRIIVVGIMAALVMVSVSFAWLGDTPDYQIVLYSANTSYKVSESNAPPWGTLADNWTNGYPLTFQVYVVPYDQGYAPASNYNAVSLQWHYGTDTGASTNWTTISTITANFNSYTGKVATFTFQEWTPPTLNTNYLIRLYSTTLPPLSAQNLDPTETDVTCDGNGLTHDDEEVMGIYVIGNKRPGTE